VKGKRNTTGKKRREEIQLAKLMPHEGTTDGKWRRIRPRGSREKLETFGKNCGRGLKSDWNCWGGFAGKIGVEDVLLIEM